MAEDGSPDFAAPDGWDGWDGGDGWEAVVPPLVVPGPPFPPPAVQLMPGETYAAESDSTSPTVHMGEGHTLLPCPCPSPHVRGGACAVQLIPLEAMVPVTVDAHGGTRARHLIAETGRHRFEWLSLPARRH